VYWTTFTFTLILAVTAVKLTRCIFVSSGCVGWAGTDATCDARSHTDVKDPPDRCTPLH